MSKPPHDECPPTGSRIAAMSPRLRWAWLTGALGLIVLLSVLSRPGERGLTGHVVRVVDGNTIEVQLPSRVERVRYIGVDALQADRAASGDAPGEPSPAEVNRRLVEKRTVRLELDAQERDADGRLLAYVYVGTAMVNADLVMLGYARVMTAPPNVRHQDLFVKHEREAREQRRGFWDEPRRAR